MSLVEIGKMPSVEFFRLFINLKKIEKNGNKHNKFRPNL
jgi:hypothetical protein